MHFDKSTTLIQGCIVYYTLSMTKFKFLVKHLNVELEPLYFETNKEEKALEINGRD